MTLNYHTRCYITSLIDINKITKYNKHTHEEKIMNYRELQAAIKQFRTQGLTEKSFKLNQKKTVLMSEYERVTKLDIRPDKSTDMDEVSLLKIRIAELESENKSLKNKLDIANETIDALNEAVDSTTTKFDEYIENVSELVKESYQSGYNDCKKDLEFDETLPDCSDYHSEDDTAITHHQPIDFGYEIDDESEEYGYSSDDTIEERLDKQFKRLHESIENFSETIDTTIESSARLGYNFRKYEESVTNNHPAASDISDITIINPDDVVEEIEYEVIECEYGEVIESETSVTLNFDNDGDFHFNVK